MKRNKYQSSNPGSLFKGITHVIPSGREHAPGYNYSLVGSVPAVLCDGRAWQTIAQIKEAFALLDYGKLCDSATCACAKLLAEKERS